MLKDVSIPKRVSEALKPVIMIGICLFCCVSIPKRVSEALKHFSAGSVKLRVLFQSLKGFQRL